MRRLVLNFFECSTNLLKDLVCCYHNKKVLYKNKMTQFTPVDFVAPNVRVSIVFDIDPSKQWTGKWENGTVVKVHKRGTMDNGDKYVTCEVQLEDTNNTTVFERFHDYDYKGLNEYSWMFTKEYTPLIEHIMKTNELTETDEASEPSENEDEEGNDPDYEPSEADDEETSDDESDVSSEDEDHYAYDRFVYPQRRPPSRVNAFFATMFALSPWFATLAVVFNAREDIFRYLQKKYC